MKTILHITECLGSGVLYYVKNLCEWQIKDFRVIVAYSTRPETPEDFKKQFDSKVEFIRVNGFTREIRPLHDMTAFVNIRRIVKRVNPDLIHLHSTKAGVLGRWAIDCNKYRVLYSPHAYSFLMENCSYTKRQIYKSIEKLSDRKKVVTVTDIDGELEASKCVTHNSICIPNGINCSEMDALMDEARLLIESNKVKDSDVKTVCMIGKVVPQKNPSLFNEIAHRFKEVRFVWIGAGPLENQLDSENIEITGWISRSEAVARIMTSDLVLFTSKWESLSIALLEAMYIGKMCIVSNADGNKDVVKDGINGYVCKEIADYISYIKEALADPDMIKKMGEKSRLAVIEKYNLTAMENEYKKYFKLWNMD